MRALNERGQGKLVIFNQYLKKWHDSTKVTITGVITNSKSYGHFQLTPQSTTLDDFERPYHTLLHK